MDRRKNMCIHIVPVYYGDRPASTRGKPNEGKDFCYQCYHSSQGGCGYRQEKDIEKLCHGCKKYHYVKPLTKEEIRERYYNGKKREVLVVGILGWHFETR